MTRQVLPDIIAPGLDVLFVGINPGLMSAAKRQHFARPGNRFWPALYASGFTPRLFTSADQRELLTCGCGITNFVARATAGAADLDADELRAGRRTLERKVRRYRPRLVAVVGIGAYRTAFDRPRAILGGQAELIGDSRLWVLPNTSGLNAHHRPADFANAFAALRMHLRA